MCDYSCMKFIIREGADGNILGGSEFVVGELKLVKLPGQIN